MFPDEFDYERTDSVADALDRLGTHADAGRGVELLAGGHGLIPALKARERTPDVVVDLAVEELAGVEERADHLAIGALTTYADLADSEPVRGRAPVLAAAAAETGDVQIRNRGTLGGNLVEAHPASDPPAAMLAADATLVLRGPEGERDVPATDFFRGDRETAVGTREILTEIRLPTAGSTADDAATDSAYVRHTHPATGYALVGVAAVLERVDGVVTDARVAATGVVDRPLRLPSVEAALSGNRPADALDEAVAVADADVDADRLRSDAYASGEFREHLLETYVERALTESVE